MTHKKEIIETFKLNIGGIIDDAGSLLCDVIDSKNKPLLQLNIDATHSGRLTNDRVYPGIHVRDSVKTFLKPTPRPVLKNHSTSIDPIGRVADAKFVQLKQGKSFDSDFKRPSLGQGSGLIQLDLDIMDADAMEKFIDGRFKEFSTRQGFDSFFCSFCGNDYMKGYCGHYPGDTVTVEATRKGGKDREFKVYGITGPLEYREVSTVSIPGDAFTKINEMKASQDSLSDNFVISVFDEFEHDMSGLVLTTDAGSTPVDLLRSGNRQAVTAEDRERLTNKSIFCVAGPEFQLQLENTDMAKEKVDPEIEDPVEDTEENTTDVKDQTDDSGESSQENQTEDKQEGVVAPDDDGTDNEDETNTDVSEKDIQDASIKALVESNRRLDADLKDGRSEIERLKGEITKKDEEVERLRTSASDYQSKLKESTAKQLLDIKIILGKSDVASVKDTESYTEKLVELTKRSLDSLEDALSDITPELTKFKDSKGVISIVDKVVEDPTLEGSPDEEKITPQQSKDDESKAKPATRGQMIDAHFN